MANDFCNGIPLSGQDSTGAIVYDAPRTGAAVFDAAIASADSGLALIPATAAAAILSFAARCSSPRRARCSVWASTPTAAALVNVTDVPNTFTYDITFSTSSGDNTLWAQPASSRRYTIGDSLEGRGTHTAREERHAVLLAQDPRVPSQVHDRANGKDTTLSQDGAIPSRTTSLWARSTTVAVYNGLDARLIEAEGKAQGE